MTDTDIDTTSHGDTPQKDQLIKRLSRIEGQVRGIAKMVEDDRYCIDVLQQVSAVKAAIDKVALGVLDGHVHHCMAAGADDHERRGEMTTELMGAVSRLVRS
ncbi:metal-sensitive transcriptional regulator [soil metagenome]|jgi:DNA-binding FrmR family transcriptional regulator